MDNPGKFIPGIITFNMAGKNTLEKIKEDLVLLDAASNMIFYFGDKNKLNFQSKNLFYKDGTKLLKDKHQDFLSIIVPLLALL